MRPGNCLLQKVFCWRILSLFQISNIYFLIGKYGKYNSNRHDLRLGNFGLRRSFKTNSTKCEKEIICSKIKMIATLILSSCLKKNYYSPAYKILFDYYIPIFLNIRYCSSYVPIL